MSRRAVLASSISDDSVSRQQAVKVKTTLGDEMPIIPTRFAADFGAFVLGVDL